MLKSIDRQIGIVRWLRKFSKGHQDNSAQLSKVSAIPECTGDRMEMRKRQPLTSLAVEQVRLAEAVRYPLPGATVYTNMIEFDPEFALHLSRDIYSDRTAHVSPIDLVRLESAAIYPDDYIVTTGASVVEEQVPPWVAAGAAVSLNASMRSEEISLETVIVARYGAWTWGHWLGELLPKIVMVEAEFPGRFCFAVPQTYDRPEWRNFRESISAYGIQPERLLLLESDRVYTLLRAWAVTSIWSDHVMHPAAAELMRRSLRAPLDKGGAAKVALLRQPGAARVLENWGEISSLLADDGYETVDIAQISFADQVRTFRKADAVFSTLGSGLTGLIYSPIGVAVTSVAPAVFGDRFFYALVVDRGGRYADVRGPTVSPDPNIPHRGSFMVSRAHVAQALATVSDRELHVPTRGSQDRF
jgi:Glycosyltransferase 61